MRKKNLSVFAMILCCVSFSNAQTQRDPWLWPFAQNSIWNMPIGADAQYVNANIGPAGFVGVDDEFLYIVPQGSPIRSIYGPHSWNDRCPLEDADKYQGQMQIQDDLVIGDATGSETPNNVATFLQNDGRTLIQLAPFTRCTAGGTVFGWKRPDLDIKGPGIEGAHWGSGLSGIGGSIRLGELIGSEPIKHALKINIFAEKYFYYESDRQGYRWPADRQDSYAAERYGIQDPQLSSPNRALVLGSLMAIPPTVTEASLNLVTTPAKKIFKALQDYGAYIVDDAAWDAHYVCAEDGVKSETEAHYGISMHGYGGDYRDDINKIFQALKVVDNNSATNIGGGGTLRAPLAPPFMDEPSTEVPVKIMPLGNSLTEGENFSPSYRGPLRKMLVENGYTNIDFVGNRSGESPSDVSPVDPHHAGHSGWTIGPSNQGYSIYQSIEGIMTSQPDIVLLEIGVNDFFNSDSHGTNYQATADDRYQALVQRIRELKPGVKVLVASLVPVKWDVNWSNSGEQYNLNQRIESLPGIFPNVYFVDMFDKMKAVIDPNTDYRDDIHLSQQGAQKMAQVWYDALIPHLTGSGPVTPALPGKIEAEDFDTMNGIQTESTTDTGGGSNVGYIDAGDWMDFNVNVQTAGTYSFTYRVASLSGGGQLQLKEGSTVFHTVTVPSTGGWQTWTTVNGTATLTAGSHTLRIHASGGGWNINWFEAEAGGTTNPSVLNPGFEADGATQTPTGWSEWSNASTSYTETGSGSHGGTYHLTHWSSSSYEVATYQTVTGLANGTYTLSVWVMSSGGQSYCQLGAYGYGGADIYVNVPATSTWTLLQIPGIVISNGQCTVDIYSLGNAGNWAVFDDVSLIREGSSAAAPVALSTEEDAGFSAYPVPSKGDLTLDLHGFKDPKVTITNFMGRMIFTSHTQESKLTISQDLPKGIYNITVRDARHKIDKKIVIE